MKFIHVFGNDPSATKFKEGDTILQHATDDSLTLWVAITDSDVNPRLLMNLGSGVSEFEL